MTKLLVGLLGCGLVALAAVDGTVDITVSRTVSPVAAEAVFQVNASAPSTHSLAQVVAVLEPVGVRSEHLRSISYSSAVQRGSGLSGLLLGDTPATGAYTFELKAPASRLESLSTEMDKLFHTPPAPLLQFSFSARLVVSEAALEKARLAALPGLFDDAKAKAESVLAAAGRSPGPVVGLWDEVNSGFDLSAVVKLSLQMSPLTAALPSSGSLGRGVTVVARRGSAVAFDTAAVSITTSLGREEALKLLTPLGVTASQISNQSSNLSPGNSFFPSQLSNYTVFSWLIPAVDLPAFLAATAKLQADSTKDYFQVSASLQRSEQALNRERDRVMPALLQDARVRAEPLARLLNLPLGSPRAMADDVVFVGVGGVGSGGLGYLGLSESVLGGISFGPGLSGDFLPAGLALRVEFAVD